MRDAKRAFTLIELMVVIAIMGLMGTLSIGGYRSMRRGMEERGVMQNVNQFVRNAYQRAMIDRQPTMIYFWNETLREESDTQPIIVVGRAVAIRRVGRVSRVVNDVLLDEFGDLKYYAARDAEGEEVEEGNTDEADEDLGIYIYKINGNESNIGSARDKVSTTTVGVNKPLAGMLSDPLWSKTTDDYDVSAYGYKLKTKNAGWKIGDAYGFEFADLTLPNNYIFGSSYSKSTKNPVQNVSTVMKFNPKDGIKGASSVVISSIQPNSSGDLAAKKIDSTISPDSSLEQQTE